MGKTEYFYCDWCEDEIEEQFIESHELGINIIAGPDQICSKCCKKVKKLRKEIRNMKDKSNGGVK